MAKRRRGELALALQAVAVDHGLRELGTDLGHIEALARATGASAAFLGGALVHDIATPNSTVDLYLLGPSSPTAPGAGQVGRKDPPVERTTRVEVVWLDSGDLGFVSDAASPDPWTESHRIRLLADVERAFPVFGVQAVIELMMSPDPQRLFRWVVGCLVRMARSRLEEARGLVGTDLSRHAALPLGSAALTALSAILWTRGVPVPDPSWATAIAERNNQIDTLIEQAYGIALPDRCPEPEEFHERSRRVETLIASAESWAP